MKYVVKKLKNGEFIELAVYKTFSFIYHNVDETYTVIAHKLDDLELENSVGIANFRFTGIDNSTLFLKNIVTKPEYLGLGVGSALLEVVEAYAWQMGCTDMSAICCPHGVGKNRTVGFYINHDFNFVNEITWTGYIQKKLSKPKLPSNKMLDFIYSTTDLYEDTNWVHEDRIKNGYRTPLNRATQTATLVKEKKC